MNARDARRQGVDTGYSIAVQAMWDPECFADGAPWDGTLDSLADCVVECEVNARQYAGSIAEEHLSDSAWDAYDAGVEAGARAAYREYSKVRKAG